MTPSEYSEYRVLEASDPEGEFVVVDTPAYFNEVVLGLIGVIELSIVVAGTRIDARRHARLGTRPEARLAGISVPDKAMFAAGPPSAATVERAAKVLSRLVG